MEKEEIITFSKPWDIFISNEPSSTNGNIQVEKYKITIEKLEEPKETIFERLELLWVTDDNFHNYEPLERKAKELGYVFKGRFGEKNITK